MASATLVARFVLAVVFAVAAAAKLLDRSGTREAVAGFGVSRRLAPVLALLIPAAELGAATLLLITPAAPAGAIASLALLSVFSAAVAINLARGRTPDCHCFGQLHSAPAGPRVLVRNSGLAALAALVLIGRAEPVPDAVWLGAAAGLVAALVAVGALSALRAHGRLLLRVDELERVLAEAGIAVEGADLLEVLPPQAGLAPGAVAPAFELPDATGGPRSVALSDLLAPGRPLLLVFVSPGCGPCSALMPELARWQRDHSDRLTVAVASDGTVGDVRAKANEVGASRVLLDVGGAVYERYQADGTPGAVLIGPDGAIASWVASGGGAIERLARSVLDVPGLPVGAPGPRLELPTLGGEAISQDGSETLVLFWNPDCGYCRRMHEDLLAWERRSDRPRLLVVSSGDAERTREDGFRSTVAIDPHFSAGGAFGVSGTPSAVLLDADGRVASLVAAGTPAVLGLIGAGEGVAA